MSVAVAEQVMVSVVCFTYNHESYVVQALEGFLAQKRSFKMEVIVHDDASTDGTAAIVRGYEAKYPGLFECVYESENKYSESPTSIVGISFNRARGKYIALCEGDDFWTDPLKLQQQVDLLEAHAECSVCFHWAAYLEEASLQMRERPMGPPPEIAKARYSLEDLLRYDNFVPTCSVLIRRSSLPDPLPDWYYGAKIGDFPLLVLAARSGEMLFIDRVMATYRIHSGGAWTSGPVAWRREISCDTYRRIGVHLRLAGSAAFKAGIAGAHYSLAVALWGEGKRFRALYAYLAAIGYSFPRSTLALVARLVRGLLKRSLRLMRAS